MVTKEDLKKIVLLSHLTDPMLDKLIPVTDFMSFEEKEVIFQQNDSADRLYMVLRGKVLLQQRITEKITISFSAIKPGFTFGWSAMLDDETYRTEAVCAIPAQLLSYRSAALKALAAEDHALGSILYQRLMHIIQKRYDICTDQFIRTIKHHPDLKDLL